MTEFKIISDTSPYDVEIEVTNLLDSGWTIVATHVTPTVDVDNHTIEYTVYLKR